MHITRSDALLQDTNLRWMETDDGIYHLVRNMSIPILRAEKKHEMIFTHDKDIKDSVKQVFLIAHNKIGEGNSRKELSQKY